MIGKALGWLNIEISNITIYGFVVLLVMSSFLDKNDIEIGKVEKTWTILIYLGTYLLIILAAYLSWTTVGAERVMGVQGRYFIPILALPLICFCNKDSYLKFRNIDVKLSIISVILNIVAITNVIEFFV